MRIFVSAGEPSGDLHAANLIQSLRKRIPDAEFVGFGGERMEQAGASLLFPLVTLAVMWFGRVLLNIHKFFRLLYVADQSFATNRPDVVILIDYPGFHWWLARRAKARGIPVVYYVPPQLWAWAGWRVKRMRRFVDHVLCSLPFEPAWYHARGVPGAVHVGHPYFDELTERHLDENFLREQQAQATPLLAILPGSRTQELIRNLPVMIRAAQKLAATRSDVRFAIASLHERHQTLARQILERDAPGFPVEIHAGKTPELIRAARLAWAVSGSVGLELMMEALPTVVLYKIRSIDLMIARPFIKAKYISLVNLLADAEVMPEYLTAVDVSTEMAEWAGSLLAEPSKREHSSAVLAALRDRVAQPGASERAADRIVQVLRQEPNSVDPASTSPVRGTHPSRRVHRGHASK